MKRVSVILFFVVWAFISTGSLAFAQQDKKGCRDHPHFTRMPNFYISSCETKEYDEVDFWESSEGQKSVKVGGIKYSMEYSLQKGIEPMIRIAVGKIKRFGGI